MHPNTLAIYQKAKRQYAAYGEQSGVRKEWLRLIEEARHIHLSQGIYDLAHQMTHEIFRRATPVDGKLQAKAPTGGRLPADSVVLTVETNDYTSVFLLYKTDIAQNAWCCVSAGVDNDFVGFTPLAGLIPGQGFLDWTADVLSAAENGGRAACSDDQRHLICFKIAVCMSLVNEPRRVLTNPASGLNWSRQHRKAVECATGKAALAYTVVSWELGAAVRARITTGDDKTLKQPLHWCRGHWRRARQGMDRAEWISPTQGAPAGWYIWVQDYWKGHPSLGIKLQMHAPRRAGEKSAQSTNRIATPSAEKLAVMSAQQRALLVQSGIVPSATVH